LKEYPQIFEGIQSLEQKGFPILVKDASLGGQFPVICVTLMNPKTGGVFASFGAHPSFEIALERSLTELLQGRSFEGLNDMPPPSFNHFSVTEQNNIVDHFIDSTGVISWKFFSQKSNYEFHHWNFSGTTKQEFHYLMGITEKIKKEVYIADYNDLGAYSCRILIPDYSEIYPVEELIWDNNNKALHFRKDILQIHQLNNQQLESLVLRLEESELDNFMEIIELIGVAFDENSTWGQLVIGELKGLIYLALGMYENALEYIELFFTFNESSPERKKYYQILNVLLNAKIGPEFELEEFVPNLIKMYGKGRVDIALKTISGEIRFYGLKETNLNFKGLDKHIQLIKSYRKLLKTRQENRVVPSDNY
jgi:ribosomal protein S12 methylthiotransferase accessory factor